MFIFGDISLIFDIFIGIVHCENLSRLIVMLRSMKPSNLSKNSGTKWFLHALTITWIIIGIAETVLLFFNSGGDQFKYLLTIFTLLTISVITLTIWLTHEMKAFAGMHNNMFKSERRTVIITSLVFCSGFIL